MSQEIIWFYCSYHLDLCKNVFGEGVYPEVEMTNIYYGGTKIAGYFFILWVLLLLLLKASH